MAKPFLSVIVPAYNEADRLPLALIDIDRHLRAADYDYEIIIIDDGSTDNTSEIVKRFLPLIKNSKLINNVGNRGKGAAVKIGMLTAKGNWRLMMDADNAIPVTEFNKIMTYATQGFDIIIGSRGVKGTKMQPSMPTLRQLSEWLLNLFIRLLLRSRVKDSLLGFGCFSSEAAEKIFSLTKYFAWSFAQEAIVLGERLGFRIKEISVSGSHAAGSHFELKNYLQMIWETIKIWWWLKRGKYGVLLNS